MKKTSKIIITVLIVVLYFLFALFCRLTMNEKTVINEWDGEIVTVDEMED